MSVSRKAAGIPSFIVMDVLDRAVEMQNRGIDVVHMEVGEPDFDTPPAIVEAGVRALRGGATHYTHSLGTPALREAIARHYQEKYGVTVPVERILCTMGSSPAMLLAFAGLCDPGDEIVVPDPGYPCYQNMISYVGGEPRPVHVREENGFEYRVEDIRAALSGRTKAVIVNSPANPTGCVSSPATLAAVAELGPWVVSDEIYHGMVYEGEDRTLLEFTDRAFVVSGFSKLWAMTGWRLGWIIAPPAFVRPLQKLQQNFFISAADFVQAAGVAALDEEHPAIEAMVRTYAERRAFLLEALPRIGLDIRYTPRGAFYVFVDVSAYTSDCYRFAFDILEEAHVAVTPGVDFGRYGECHLRFSYATSLPRLREGVERLGAFLARRGPRSG